MSIPLPDALKLFISRVFSCDVDRGYRVSCDTTNAEISTRQINKINTVRPVKAIDYVAMYKLKQNTDFYLVGTKRSSETGNVIYILKDSKSNTDISLSEKLFKLLFEKIKD